MSTIRLPKRVIALALLGSLSMVPLGCGGGGAGGGPAGGSGLVTLTSFQAAAVVIGQAGFTGGLADQGGVPGANTSNTPGGMSAGSLFIADFWNQRVLGFNAPPTASNASADFVLGQPDFLTTHTLGAPSAIKFQGPMNVCVSGGRLYMVSFSSSRMLVWNDVPAATGVPADLVLGQVFLTTGAASTTQAGLANPEGISVVGSKILVADTANNRVMIWLSVPVTNNAPADLVLGQAAFDTSASGTSQTALDAPKGVWTDGTRVVVTDSTGDRVLLWNTFPTMTNQPADVVLGQTNFLASLGGDGPSKMRSPIGVCSNGTQLFVADTGNNRVLIWNTFPTGNAQPADVVLGQGDFVHVTPNDDNQNGNPELSPTARTMQQPYGVKVSGNRLFVSDRDNHRTLIFNGG